jgi:hypothetical protein
MTRGLDDEELLAALEHAISARRSVPAEFVDAGKSAFAWHNIDAELAQLTYDSRVPDHAAATRAEAASIRALTFTSTQLTIELEVTHNQLLGQVVPAQAALIEVQTRAGAERTIPCDEIGCFSIEPIPLDQFRLRCQTPARAEVLTSWITL